MRKSMTGIFLMCLVATMGLASVCQALQVTQNSNASDLVAALFQGNTGIQEITWSLSGRAEQSGTFTNLSKVYSAVGLDSGIVLSTGRVADYSDGPSRSTGWSSSFGTPASKDQNILLNQITGEDVHFDTVQMDLTFTMDANYDKLLFNMAFGSEEFSDWSGTAYNDGFGIFLNGVNIATAGDLPITISHPSMASVPGTELDGVMTAQFEANPLLNGQENTLTLILGDANDGLLDTTVFVSAVGRPIAPAVPEPASLVLALTGGVPLLGLVLRRRRQA